MRKSARAALERWTFALLLLLALACFCGALAFLLTHNIDQTYDLPPEEDR